MKSWFGDMGLAHVTPFWACCLIFNRSRAYCAAADRSVTVFVSIQGHNQHSNALLPEGASEHKVITDPEIRRPGFHSHLHWNEPIE